MYKIYKILLTFLAEFVMMHESSEMRKCWNWQTGKTKDLVSV